MFNNAMSPANAMAAPGGIQASPYGSMQDWRAARPDMSGMQGQGRNALMDWRALRPDLAGMGQHGGGFGGVGGGGPVAQPFPIQQLPPLPPQALPQGYAVANMTPSGSPYQFPMYHPGG